MAPSLVASALLLLALTASGPVAGSPTERSRPNVLFIAVNDLRPEIGAYGNPHVKTPLG